MREKSISGNSVALLYALMLIIALGFPAEAQQPMGENPDGDTYQIPDQSA